MDDRQLANAAAVYFGGRRRAEHVLTCESCRIGDDARPVLCPQHPDRRERRSGAWRSS
jgi:hypothetical protein